MARRGNGWYGMAAAADGNVCTQTAVQTDTSFLPPFAISCDSNEAPFQRDGGAELKATMEAWKEETH